MNIINFFTHNIWKRCVFLASPKFTINKRTMAIFTLFIIILQNRVCAFSKTSMLSNPQVSAPYKRMGATHGSNSVKNMPTGRLSLRPFCITEYMTLVVLTANFAFALVNFPFQVNNIPR